MNKNITRAVFVAGMMFLTSPAIAGSVANTCLTLAAEPGSFATEFDRRVSVFPGSNGATVVATTLYDYRTASSFLGFCGVEETSVFENDANKPAQGESESAEDEGSGFSDFLNGVYRRLRTAVRPAREVDTNGFLKKTRAAVTGTRGSIGFLGGTLSENSPAWVMSMQDTGETELFLPFIVENAGDGDVLSIFNNDELV